MLASRIAQLGRALALLALCAALGAVVGCISYAFIEGSAWLFARGAGAADAPWYLLLLLPGAAGLLSGLLCMRTSRKVAPGPADVARAHIEGLRLVSRRDGLLAATAAFGGLALGGSVGAYGPVVHLGSTLAAQLTRLLFNERAALQIGLASGCAAAIAAAFSAPLAGIIFAHEVILRHYSLRVFAAVASAALMANFVVRSLFGREAFLHAAMPDAVGALDSGLIVGVGLLCGALAAGIITGCINLAAWYRRLPAAPWVFPALGGLGCGAVALAFGAPEVLGGGQPLMEAIAAGDPQVADRAATLLVVKFVATMLCIGLGMAGGLFSPALVVGALFGYSCGLVIDGLVPGAASPLFYAVVGMFATAAPVIGAPLAGILIAVEFSQSYPLAVSVALAIVISSTVASRLAGGSYYQILQLRAGVPALAGAEERVLSRIKVASRMRPLIAADDAWRHAARTIGANASVWDALAASSGVAGERLVVVDAGDQPVGAVVVEELLVEQAMLNRRFREEEGQL